MNTFVKKRPYTQLAKHRESKCRRFITSEIDFNIKSFVLEIGSGMGRQALWFASTGVNIMSLEINLKSCRATKEKLVSANLWNHNAYIIRADGQNLPFRDNAFDVIFCKAVLHHVPNICKLITEMHRVVKKNGLVAAVDEPNGLNPLWHLAKFLTKRFHFRAYFLQSGEFVGRINFGPTMSPFYPWHLDDYFKQGHFKLVKRASIWLPYATYSRVYFKLWLMLERIVERTFIPYVFGQLFIVAKK